MQTKCYAWHCVDMIKWSIMEMKIEKRKKRNNKKKK